MSTDSRVGWTRGWPEYLAIAIIAAAGAWQLLIPPVIGIADNGDFPRIMSRFDIGYTSEKFEERYFGYFNSQYRVDSRDHWDSGFASSQTLLVALARPLNSLLSKPGFFDIRSVAVVHLALELIAAWLLLMYAPVTGSFGRAGLLVIVTLALTDAAYVSYFNSFYSEPGTFVFLLLALGAILKTINRPTGGALLLFCLASLLFITSKPQNVVPGIVLAAYALRLGVLHAGRTWRRTCAAVALFLLAGSFVYYKLKPTEVITKPSYYISVFYEILRFSPDPRQDLAELGLDPDLAKYAGTIPFPLESPKNDPDFQRSFFDRMSFGKVIWFHLKHPVRFLGSLERSAQYAPLLRPALGNFERSAGHPPFATSQTVTLWSRAHQAWFPGSVIAFLGFFALNWAGIVILYRKKRTQSYRLLLELQAVLLLIAALQFPSVVVAQGTYEPVKHLFLFNLLVHVCFAITLIWLADCAQLVLGRTGLSNRLLEGMRYRRWRECLVIAAIAAGAVWQLLFPPLIGLADQGDFSRIMGRFDIGHISDKYEDRYFGYFNSKYRIDKKERWESEFVSSQTLIVALAQPINRLFSKAGFFDIRSVAVIHVALELGAAWLLMAAAPVYAPVAREVFLGLVFLLFTDVGYISYFNSFFSEPGSFLFLLLTLGAILMTIMQASNGALAGLLVAGLLFITSKPQNATAGLILAAYSLRLCNLRVDKAWRVACVGIAVVLALTSVYYVKLTPRDITLKPARFLSVFWEILPYSSAPRQDLIELGVDPKLVKYSGTNPWAPDAPTGDPEFHKSFFDKVGLVQMIRFHLHHPVRLLQLLDRCAGYAPELRPWVGNYERAEGRFGWAKSRSFNLWGSLREKYSPGSLKSLVLFFSVYFGAIIVLYRRAESLQNRLILELLASLLLTAILQFLTVSIGAGTHEATKHLFLFDLLVDLCVATGIIWLTAVLIDHSRRQSLL